MNGPRILPCLSVLLFGLSGHAQNKAEVVWRPLTDSVYQVLHLSEDQIARSRTIDAHYNEERHKLQADTQVPATERERTLSGLVAAREKEIQGVMTRDQFQQWIGKPLRPGTKRLKGTPSR